jgi:hypothetical protein
MTNAPVAVEDLDVTLQNPDTINVWLAGWLVDAATHPGACRAFVVEDSHEGTVVELRNEAGEASGGYIFLRKSLSRHIPAIHVLPAIDPHRSAIKKRSMKEFVAAHRAAMEKRKCEARCLERYNLLCCVSLVLAAGIIIELLRRVL